MADLTNLRLIKLRRVLFLAIGILSSVLLVTHAPSLSVAFLLATAI